MRESRSPQTGVKYARSITPASVAVTDLQHKCVEYCAIRCLQALSYSRRYDALARTRIEGRKGVD